jgi:hypothetical protein
MGLIVDDPIYYKGELFGHVGAAAKQDLPLGSYVVVDVVGHFLMRCLSMFQMGHDLLLDMAKVR